MNLTGNNLIEPTDMNHIPRIFLLGVLVCFGNCGPLAAADPESGRVLARQCSVCHGKTGIANDPEVPHLAGQSAFYLEKSLKDYRSGTRMDRRMSLLAKDLDDEQIRNLAAWYASITIEARIPE